MEPDRKTVVALAGNPNVGKSTVFNQLTGLKQHTGNWSGKTVSNAAGNYIYKQKTYELIDIPGCYSLMAHLAEEETARDFICFGQPDIVIVVCDATCLERNLNLVLQVREVCNKLLVCINLMDEAKKKKITIDLSLLSELLACPVVATTARDNQGLERLKEEIDSLGNLKEDATQKKGCLPYLEESIGRIRPYLEIIYPKFPYREWLAERLLEGEEMILPSLQQYGLKKGDPEMVKTLIICVEREKNTLFGAGHTKENISDEIANSYVRKAEQICTQVMKKPDRRYDNKDRILDRIFTGRKSGFAVMTLMVLFLFWLTISASNYPSLLLNKGFAALEPKVISLFIRFGMPDILLQILVHGVYRVLTWVVAVMLPPMAIFFPLFTLLEDFGYLPRVAYNLDRCFEKCNTCGKQALTMCMGLGCNAVGVTGCRIIDSHRERLIAMLTNCFVPCNGRFPTLIALSSLLVIGIRGHVISPICSAAILTCTILIGIGVTFLVSYILSKTLLRGVPSSFTLELPPYRRPQIRKVMVRSVFNRTLFVLGRAVLIAAPAGLIIWLMANVTVGGGSLLTHCANFLDPFARYLGLDGVILMAFILGLPANEIVVPIIIMAYTAQGSLQDMIGIEGMHQLFLANGWSITTIICTMLFSLTHWPCSTTLLTIKRESGNKWMVLGFVIPTVVGIGLCFLASRVLNLFY